MITQKKLKKLLSYNKNSGIFTKKAGKRNNQIAVGDIVGTVDKDGYIVIRLDGKIYKAHRLAWLYEYGKFPENEIDHKNHIVSDNRIDNLRDVTNRENGKNKSLFKNNSSGVMGVGFNKKHNRWRARINVDGKTVYLGSFVSFSEAVDVRKNAEVLYGFHKNHGKQK